MKKEGRKPKAMVRKPTAYLPIELYTISYSTEFVRGAKKEIRDDNGKLLYNARQMRTHIGGTYTKELATAIRDSMKEDGLKNIEMKKTSLDLPSKCPSCEREGTPAITEDKRAELLETKHRLNYNHTSSPKTCYVATVTLGGIVQIKLKKGLPIDSLGYRRRVGNYPFDESIH